MGKKKIPATAQAIHSSVKSVNQKIRRLARKYGTDNIEYKRYIADIDRNFGTHLTSDGIVQLNTLKLTENIIDGKVNVRGVSQYQVAVLNKLRKGKGIKALEAASKKRLIESAKARGIPTEGKGAYKPTKAEVEKEVQQFSDRQSRIDNTLDLIYLDERDGSLPYDIADIYNKLRNRGKGGGMGVTNDELDTMIEKVERWQDLKEQVERLSRDIQRNSPNGIVDSYIESEVWAAMSGRYAVDTVENDIIPTLENYLEELTT